MKKKNLITLTAAVSLVSVIGIGSTLAYFTDSDSATNVVTMGHVDITLTEPTFSEENADNTIKNVVPNQEITKDPTITVLAGSESCYLRAKIEFSDSLKDVSGERDYAAELLENINVGEEWVLSTDGYYYYQNKVEKSTEAQDVVLFDTVVIPELWGNEVADLAFEIEVTAEAIQADNFEPAKTDGVINGWMTSDGKAITTETYVEPAQTSNQETTQEN